MNVLTCHLPVALFPPRYAFHFDWFSWSIVIAHWKMVFDIITNCYKTHKWFSLVVSMVEMEIYCISLFWHMKFHKYGVFESFNIDSYFENTLKWCYCGTCNLNLFRHDFQIKVNSIKLKINLVFVEFYKSIHLFWVWLNASINLCYIFQCIEFESDEWDKSSAFHIIIYFGECISI